MPQPNYELGSGRRSRVVVKLLRAFATAWFVLASLLIFVSTAMIWYTDGFGRVQEIFSPFNVINSIAVMVTLAPGIGARILAERLESLCQTAPDREGRTS